MEKLTSKNPVPYETALSAMEARVASIHENNAGELLWFLEHPPLYTAGTSAKDKDLLNPQFPVYRTGRGGQYTYHGPGQRVVYMMLDLKKRQKVPDIKKYIWQLEEWIIRALTAFDVSGERRDGRIGIWIDTGKGEEKIAAIGVRVRHWVAYHGIAINVDPDLSHYAGIIPCGVRDYGVTSLSKVLGYQIKMEKMDEALSESWNAVFETSCLSSVA